MYKNRLKFYNKNKTIKKFHCQGTEDLAVHVQILVTHKFLSNVFEDNKILFEEKIIKK